MWYASNCKKDKHNVMKFATDIEMMRLKSMKVSIAYENTYNRHLCILLYLFKKNKPQYQIHRPILSLIWYGYLNKHKPTGWRHYVLIQDIEIFFRTCTDVRCHGHHAAMYIMKSRAAIYSREVINTAVTLFCMVKLAVKNSAEWNERHILVMFTWL